MCISWLWLLYHLASHPGAVMCYNFCVCKTMLEGHLAEMCHIWHNTSISHWPTLCVCRDSFGPLLCMGANCELHNMESTSPQTAVCLFSNFQHTAIKFLILTEVILEKGHLSWFSQKNSVGEWQPCLLPFESGTIVYSFSALYMICCL